MLQILLVERKGQHGGILQKVFRTIDQPAQIIPVATLEAARQVMGSRSVDVILADLRLEDGLGTLLVSPAGEARAVPVVILLHARDAAMIVDVLRAGAMDVVVKGPEGIRGMPLTVTRALRGWNHIARRREAEKALEQSETRYHSLFESMRSAVVVYQSIEEGRDFLFVDCNKAAERINHLGREAVLGKRLTAIFPGVRESGLLELLRRVWQTGKPERFPLATYKDHHLEYWVEHFVYKLPGGEVVAVQDDLTNGKIAERLLNDKVAQFQAVLDHAPAVIYLKDPQGRYQFVNRRFEELLKRSRETILGKSSQEIFPEPFARRQEEIEAQILTGNVPVESEEILSLADGVHTCLAVTFPLFDADGRTHAVCGIAKDISQRKRNEEEIFQLNATLEERVRERTAQLNHSLETLRRTQKQLVESEKMASLGNLVAGVAHEINTPLGVGITAASYLQDTLQEYLRELRAEEPVLDPRLTTLQTTVELLTKNLHRAAHLIQSFRQVAVDRCVTQRRRIHLRSFIAELLTTLIPKMKENAHQIHFACPEEIEVVVYPGAIGQIVTNLVSNSLMHGFEHKTRGVIWLTVTAREQEIHLKYRDNGQGMPPEAVQKIFEPFFTTRRAQGGTGLGMHIVYNLVTQTLGGDIFCHSEPGKGIDISILFPV
ncbi:MAG: PAS domain-containing protein [Magnetococcales bacterium]|nr:PAS domain-containing protein [Magnetococcales bacterium]